MMKLDTVSKQSIAMFISTLVMFMAMGGLIQFSGQRSLDYFEQSISVKIEALANHVTFLQKQLECDK